MINRLDRTARTFGNVQGLRAIAALLVFAVHLNGTEQHFANPAHPLGWVYPLGEWGVDLFFIISGFVMITSTWHEFASPAISLRFFLRRLTRIYPAYWIAMIPIVLLFIVAPHMVNETQAIRPSIPASLLLVPQFGKPLLTISWTLVYEVFFYVVFAFVLAFDRKWCLPLIGAWAVATLVLSAVVAPLHNLYLNVYTNPLLLEFIFGVCAGYLVQTRGALLPIPSLALGITGVVLADVFYESIDRAAGFGGNLRFLCIGVPMLLIFNGVVGLETQYDRVAPAFLQRLGNASYSLYLWHVPITLLLARAAAPLLRHPNPLLHLVWLAGATVVVVGASLLLYDYVERPLLRFFGARIRQLDARLPLGRVAALTPPLSDSAAR
jgi:peptidoglycan/LPS O-acetylase OafA/YrhL